MSTDTHCNTSLCEYLPRPNKSNNNKTAGLFASEIKWGGKKPNWLHYKRRTHGVCIKYVQWKNMCKPSFFFPRGNIWLNMVGKNILNQRLPVTNIMDFPIRSFTVKLLRWNNNTEFNVGVRVDLMFRTYVRSLPLVHPSPETHTSCPRPEPFLFCSVSQWWKYCWPPLRAEMFCGKGQQCWPVMRLLHICFADPNTEDLERSWAISPAALSTWQRQRRLEVNASWQAPTSCSVLVEKITLPFLKKKKVGAKHFTLKTAKPTAVESTGARAVKHLITLFFKILFNK